MFGLGWAALSMTSRHSASRATGIPAAQLLGLEQLRVGADASATNHLRPFMDFHLIANFAALALITLAGPAVIFILFYRRGAL